MAQHLEMEIQLQRKLQPMLKATALTASILGLVLDVVFPGLGVVGRVIGGATRILTIVSPSQTSSQHLLVYRFIDSR